MSAPGELGPSWEVPRAPGELAARLAVSPLAAPVLPAPERSCAAGSLYLLSEAARAAAHHEGGVCSLAGSVCAIGAFDGVHLGHRSLIAATLANARARGLPAVALSFSPDPAEVLHGPAAASQLLAIPDRLRALAALGLDALLVIPFGAALAAMPYEAFLGEVLACALHPASVHVGANFVMGSGGAGTPAALARAGAPLGIGFEAHELVSEAGRPVSATRIRHAVRAGALGEAARLLGRDHFVRGRVVHGRGKGASFGFPTANLLLDPRLCLPAEGVYAALACVEGRAWPAAVNVGEPPSFGGRENAAFLEASLLGFSGDLYGAELAVSFVAWLRAPRRFSRLAELEQTALGNIEWVRHNLGEQAVELPRARAATAWGQAGAAAGSGCPGAAAPPGVAESGGEGA